jgi:hypothetical protein
MWIPIALQETFHLGMTLWYVFTELVAVEWIRRNIVPDGREWFRISVHTSEAFTDTSSEWNYNLSCVKQRDNNNVANAETLHYFLNSGIDNQSGSHAQIPYLQQCSQIPKSRDVTLFFLDITLYKWAAMHCLRRHPMCFYWISS